MKLIQTSKSSKFPRVRVYISRPGRRRSQRLIDRSSLSDPHLATSQTDPTSDYMQGDEDKWQKSFGAGPWMTFVDKPEEEDGKKTVQVSTTLVDNDVAIGAMTVSLDLSKVPTK